MNKQTEQGIEFTRIGYDVNGNQRYVVHFLQLLTKAEKENPLPFNEGLYEKALQRAKQLGGRKYNNKRYGGGIVFQSANLRVLAEKIVELTK